MIVKKSFYARENITPSNDIIKNITGSNRNIVDMVKKGTLETLMVTSADGGLYSTKSLGKRCNKPFKLVNLFKAVSCAYGNENRENLTYLNISSYGDDKILVSSYCNDTCDEMYMLFFNIVEGGVVLSENSASQVSQTYLISILEKYTADVINWCNDISPVPLYNIEYFCVEDKKTSYTIGSGTLYIGFSEANYDNGVSGIDCIENNRKGEYSLIFLEG